MSNKPLCQIIYENIVDGRLKKDFSLPRKEEEKLFADGAMDGIALYHISQKEITEEIKDDVRGALFAAAAEDGERASEIFAGLGEKVRMINLTQTIPKIIIDNMKELDPVKTISYALDTLAHSDNRECIKAALLILSVIKQDNSTKYLVNTVGLSDEFTYFAIQSIVNWDNANEELMDLGKRVSGWGKIHAVRYIYPETEEIKDWLLEDGINNTVLPAYSAYTVYEKAEVERRLKSENLSLKEFKCILKIMNEMLDEGPVRNISMVKNSEEIMNLIAARAEEFNSLSEEDKAILSYLKAWNNT